MAVLYRIEDLDLAEKQINNLATATQQYYEDGTILNDILQEIGDAWKSTGNDASSAKTKLEKCISNMDKISTTLKEFGNSGRDLLSNTRSTGANSIK